MTEIKGNIYLEASPDRDGWQIRIHDCPAPHFNELTRLFTQRHSRDTYWVSFQATVTIFRDWCLPEETPATSQNPLHTET